MNALIENRRKEKAADRRMIEANERSQLLYAAEKRESIILEQEKMIAELRTKIDTMNACVARDRRLRIGILLIGAWIASLLFVGFLSV